MGFNIEYGKDMWKLLLLLFSLIWNELMIIILVGFIMFVIVGFIFEFKYLNDIFMIGV